MKTKLVCEVKNDDIKLYGIKLPTYSDIKNIPVVRAKVKVDYARVKQYMVLSKIIEAKVNIIKERNKLLAIQKRQTNLHSAVMINCIFKNLLLIQEYD